MVLPFVVICIWKMWSIIIFTRVIMWHKSPKRLDIPDLEVLHSLVSRSKLLLLFIYFCITLKIKLLSQKIPEQ